MHLILNNFFKSKKVILSIYVFLLFTLVFGRSFMGLFIAKYRIGEYLIGLALLIFCFSLLSKDLFIEILDKKIYIIILTIFISFIFINLINYENLLNIYIFKASLYIWVISFIFLGYYFSNQLNISSKILFVNNFVLIAMYYLNTLGYPDKLIVFFNKYSDKFQFNKASEIIIMLLIILWVNNRFVTSKYILSYFLIVSSFYLPLFIVMSRGAALAFIVFILFELFNFKNYMFKNKKLFIFTILICFFCFYISTVIIIEDEVIVEQGYEVMLEDILATKNISNESLLFFIKNNRLYSSDGNLNWRLQIWQDIILTSNLNKKIIIGEGYQSKISAMNNPIYQGEDGTNENVHNYFINIYARGGLVHLLLFLYLYISLIKLKKSKYSKSDILTFLFPALIVSMFDSSMESPNYSFMFFFFIGCLLSNMEGEYKSKVKV